MVRSASLVRRVAWGSALAASAAALLAALVTIILTHYLLRRAEDRRIEDATLIFAALLDQKAASGESIAKVHRDESEEMEHTGILFGVYERGGKLLVGDRRLELPLSNGCSSTSAAMRACRIETAQGLIAVAGAARATLWPLLASAAVASALLAAMLAWLASLPISRVVVAPLTRLRERIAQLDIDTTSNTDLGPVEHVVEVDALRATIAQLVVRAERAIAQAQRFAANAAHELRTPLTSVQAELELLSESIADPSSRADTLRARGKLGELSVLVERLLVLSLPARSATDAQEVVSLRDLLEDTVAGLPEADRERVQLSANDAVVRGDIMLLGTMIANALSNGLKFGDAVVIELSVVGGNAVLHIDDTGPGMDPTDRERAFEPFFRTDEAQRRRLPGHGLGLALIRHIAQTHGGSASFVDTSERASRLEIRLPVQS